MFSCLQILEAFLWFVLITLLNVTLIILTLSVSRLLNLLLRLRSEERFSRNAETDLVCRLLLEKKKKNTKSIYLRRDPNGYNIYIMYSSSGEWKLELDMYCIIQEL